MFPNLKAELAKKKMNRVNLAKAIGMREITINSKIQGKHQFKLEDMLKIKEFLGVDMPLEELFYKDENTPERKKNPQRVGKYRSVNQYDREGNLIKTWDSIDEASSTLKINKSNMHKNCNKEVETAGGYIWRWVYEEIC